VTDRTLMLTTTQRSMLLLLVAMLPLAFTGAAAPLPGTDQEQMTARHVMEERRRRHDVSAEYTELVMILEERNGSKQKRLLRKYDKDVGDDRHRMLSVFMEPADIRGTALLTWDREQSDDHWLYLPSRKKLQRIAPGSRTGYFMGTDFTYEDMEREDIDRYTYSLLAPARFEGHDCFLVEATAKQGAEKTSAYGKRRLWLRKDIFFAVKIEFFDRRGRHIKTLTCHELYNPKGDVWRPRKTLMDNHSEKHKTATGLRAGEIDPVLDDMVFTQRYILSERHTR